ncbi:MAG: metalloregulator ArsR/SmtB family transcription factor [Ilumatobacteraceae bacterium]
MNISRSDATTWAAWFKAIGDPTRILILNLLATADRPMAVNEIVDALDVGQSTVSHHLKLLAEVRFLLVERQGTTSWWRINQRCLSGFPTAAELVMGRAHRRCVGTTAARHPTRSSRLQRRRRRRVDRGPKRRPDRPPAGPPDGRPHGTADR